MHLLFDIFQGIGIAAAVGIRPFLPVLAVGALAAGDVQIDFTYVAADTWELPPQAEMPSASAVAAMIAAAGARIRSRLPARRLTGPEPPWSA